MVLSFNITSQGYSCSKHGGLMFYIRSDYSVKCIESVKNSVIWEGLFVEVSKESTSEKLILGNIYKPPKQNNNLENTQQFTNELFAVIDKVQRDKAEFLLAGDYNINLLKINEREGFAEFLDRMTNSSFFPTITLPTRFSSYSCSLLDNIYHFQTKKYMESKSGIIFTDISDHLPCFTSIKFQTKAEKRPPKFVKQKINSNSALSNLLEELASKDIYNKLNHNLENDSNYNYDIISKNVQDCKEKHFLTRLVKFDKRRHENNQ